MAIDFKKNRRLFIWLMWACAVIGGFAGCVAVFFSYDRDRWLLTTIYMTGSMFLAAAILIRIFVVDESKTVRTKRTKR